MLAVLAAAHTFQPANAVNAVRSEVRTGVRDCQGALPSFEGSLRKRPLAVQNEGTALAFVTCGMEGDNSGIANTSKIFVLLRNIGTATTDVSCTLVDGGVGLFTPLYFPKTISVPVNAMGLTLIQWTAATDNGGVKFLYPAISCGLPPGVGIPATMREYTEDVGA